MGTGVDVSVAGGIGVSVAGGTGVSVATTSAFTLVGFGVLVAGGEH